MENTALTYLCPSCLAYLRYDGKEGNWVCDYCDSRFTKEELEQRGAQTKEDTYEVKPRAEAEENSAKTIIKNLISDKSNAKYFAGHRPVKENFKALQNDIFYQSPFRRP